MCGETPAEFGQQYVTVLMPQRVVDLLEAVEVNDGDRRGSSIARGVGELRAGETSEELSIRQIRERVVFRLIGIGAHLAAESFADPERDAKEDEVEQGQSDGQVPIETVDPGVHVRLDWRVGKVHLHDAYSVGLAADVERYVDLHGQSLDLPAVVTVSVEVRQMNDGLAMTRVN